jgi:hypothetical protein
MRNRLVTGQALHFGCPIAKAEKKLELVKGFY